MVATKLLLLAGILGISYGQDVYYDVGSEIRLNDGVFFSGDQIFDRKICYSGTQFFYTTGNEIRQVIGGTDTPYITAPANVDSLSCACDRLAYTYRDDTVGTLVYRNLDLNSEVTTLSLLDGTGQTSALVDRSTNRLFVVDQNGFRILSFSTGSVMETATFPQALSNPPRCIAVHQLADTWYIIVAFDAARDVIVITYDGTTVTANTRQVPHTDVNNTPSKVSCLDIEVDTLYFLHERTGSGNWRITAYDLADWLDGNVPDAPTEPPIYEGSGFLFPDVNGLVVCENCESACVRQPLLDALCYVKNPLAGRRKGEPVEVGGVTSVSATIDITRRVAKTGRWSISTLPVWTPTTPLDSAPLSYGGYMAAVPNAGRGRRFGDYVVDILPSDSNLLFARVSCIVTENSGFFNEFYSYTSTVGSSVVLEASARLGSEAARPNSMSRLVWRFTSADLENLPTGNLEGPASCGSNTGDGFLSCALNDVQQEDEGVYQCYRLGRQLRTWHAIFQLFVRACPKGNYGENCDLMCPDLCSQRGDCLNGVCLCKPGWTGDNCAIQCPDNFVGQSCTMPCEDFAGNTDCRNLLFGLPGKVGMYCRTGLKSPECTVACDAGRWGPNCENTCTAPCNPENGQ